MNFVGFLAEEINFENLRKTSEENDLSINVFFSLGECQELSEDDDVLDGWTKMLHNVYIPEFVEDVRATFNLSSEAKEINFFERMFLEEIYCILAEQTNLYALLLQVERHKVEHLTP